MSIWKGKCRKIDKPWGHEHIWAAPWGTGGKTICIDADKRTSLKYYQHKNEMLLLYSGKIIVEAPEENEFGQKMRNGRGNWFELEPGDVLFIQAANPYRLRAMEDSVLVEVTSGHMGQGDGVMLEDDYNRNLT
jgi:mannose-6-phosphate isomerase